MNGRVLSLQLLTAHGTPPRSVPEVRALVGRGLDGDIHGKAKPDSRRQVLIVDAATLAVMGLQPGALREQITIEFPPLETLPVGTLLRVGEVTFELTGPCEPCTHIGALNGVADPEAFRSALEGRRGQTARVAAIDREGRIRVGDVIAVLTGSPR
ncbi:MAG: MOSC domain-containing protein [bacterium]